jgi:hypothetical protein
MLRYSSVASLEVGGCNIYQKFSSLCPLHPALRQQIRPRSKHKRLTHKKAMHENLSKRVAFLHCKEPIPQNREKNFQEKELRGHSPNFHIHVSMSDLYIPTIDLPILLQEICGPILGIYKSLRDT